MNYRRIVSAHIVQSHTDDQLTELFPAPVGPMTLS
jgi:hypothetical protein